MLLHGLKLMKHIVMYFQACSYSAYPMHSGERYRTIGPLVAISQALWLLWQLKVSIDIQGEK